MNRQKRHIALRESIQTLYHVFSKYQSSVHMESCPDCVDDIDHARLFSTPLCELSAQDLEKYSRKAMTTWGNLDDFRHFLPRLFECALQDDGLQWIETEILFGKLNCNQSHWLDWPVNEQSAVRAYFYSSWQMILLQKETCFCDGWLTGIGCAQTDMNEYLQWWQNDPDPQAFAHLVTFINKESTSILESRTLENAFWTENRSQMMQVLRWLASSEVHQVLGRQLAKQSHLNPAEDVTLALSMQEAIAEKLQSSRQI